MKNVAKSAYNSTKGAVNSSMAAMSEAVAEPKNNKMLRNLIIIAVISTLVGFLAWWIVYYLNNSHANCYKTMAIIKCNLSEMTQAQFEAATNTSLLLDFTSKVKSITHDKAYVSIDNKWFHGHKLKTDGSVTSIDTDVTGLVVKLSLSTTGLRIDLSNNKDISNLTLADFQKFPKEIRVYWYTDDANVQKVAYTSTDFMGTPTAVAEYDVVKPEKDDALINIDMKTVHA